MKIKIRHIFDREWNVKQVLIEEFEGSEKELNVILSKLIFKEKQTK